MKRNKKRSSHMLWLAAGLAIFAAPQPALAKDDFGRIVQHIETQYHVHRQHRFVMGFAGLVVKFYHFAGVKGFKGAIFENQQFLNTASDGRFDEVVRAAMNSGWQPMVQSWDRHTGEKTYIYAQNAGKDMKVLVVNLEPNEAVVLQVKVDPEKLNEFVRQASAGHNHGEAAPGKAQAVEASAETPQSWNGVCLFVQEEPLAAGEP
jgi:hypothetical protein